MKNNLFTDTLTPTVFSPLHRLPQLKQQGHCIRMLSKPFLAGCVWCTTHTHKHCIQKCAGSDSNTTLERKISVCLYLWTVLASLLKHFVLSVMLFLDMYFELWEHLHRVYSLNFKITFRVWEVCAYVENLFIYIFKSPVFFLSDGPTRCLEQCVCVCARSINVFFVSNNSLCLVT